MSWAGSETVQVYLGHSLAIVRREADRDQRLSCTSALEGWRDVAELIGAEGMARRRTRIRLWLSGALARPYIFGPVGGLKRRSEATRIAASLAPEMTGLAGPCLAWLDDETREEACVAVAMELAIRDQIEEVAKGRGLRLTGLGPWWSAVLEAVAAGSEAGEQMLAVEEPDSLTVLSWKSGKFASTSSYAPAPASDDFDAVLMRQTLNAGLELAQVTTARLLRSDEAATTPRGAWLQAPFAVLVAP